MKETKRYGHDFGDAQFTGQKGPTLEYFYQLIDTHDYLGLAHLLGWSEACPVVPVFIERGTSKEAAQGYGELQFIRGIQLDLLKQKNPSYHKQLTGIHSRKVGEQVGEFSPDFIPSDHSQNVRGSATVVGYDIPRLTREFIGPRKTRNQNQILQAVNVFEEVLVDSTTKGDSITQFTVALADKYAEIDQNPLKYVRRLLSSGKLLEDNQLSECQEILSEMYLAKSPLYTTYAGLSSTEKASLGIADINFPSY
jgi:hypothetical protein